MLYPEPSTGFRVGQPSTELLLQLERISSDLLVMGAAIVGIKLGDCGLYLRTAGHSRLAAMGTEIDISKWADRELWATIFEANVIGTNGAGDATVAGFLFALLRALGPEDVCSAACAVGASSVESSDATSGVPTWEQVESRMNDGWRRRRFELMADWPETAPGIFLGPLDRNCS
jgi:sugar/nucleoside kinase (ribokinase family)